MTDDRETQDPTRRLTDAHAFAVMSAFKLMHGPVVHVRDVIQSNPYHHGRCLDCGQKIMVGDQIQRAGFGSGPDIGWAHVPCPDPFTTIPWLTDREYDVVVNELGSFLQHHCTRCRKLIECKQIGDRLYQVLRTPLPWTAYVCEECVKK